MGKPKAINFELIAETLEGKTTEPYRVLAEMMKFHSEIQYARIALAWRKKLKADADGILMLGRCVKISEREKAVHPLTRYDFVILLNRDVWMDGEFSIEKKQALIDHELCHAAPSLDKDFEPRYDTDGRQLYRTRKHDLEEFRCIVERHGCYKRDLEMFAEALLKKKQQPILPGLAGKPANSKMGKVLEAVAEQVNAGALNKAGVKCTAEVRK